MNFPWFEYTSDKDLRQGDLIWKCPWVKVAQAAIEPETDFRVENVHAVILTQSCDLVLRENGRPKSDTVLLAQFLTRSELAEHPNFSKDSEWEQVRKGRLARFHVLNKCKLAEGVEDFVLIDLGATFSLDFHIVLNAAVENEGRPRLCPPYREHLSQAFARYHMRVGLPSDIPAFA